MPNEDIPALLMALEGATDSTTRNSLALRLAEARAPGLDEVLVRLIGRPDLVGTRGTLVHALSYVDCGDHIGLLVGLVITGNWEVAREAFQALEAIDEIDGAHVGAAYQAVKIAQASEGLEDWRQDLLQELSEMFF